MNPLIEILIIEDDTRIAKIHEKFIEKIEGFKVIGTAHSIDEATIWIEELNPQLVLLDVYFPDRLGTDLIQFIKEKSPTTDIIFITAAAEVDIVKKAFISGVSDYLLKPLTFERFNYCLFNYKQKRALLSREGTLQNEEITSLWHNSSMLPTDISFANDSPKGIDPLTKKKVIQHVQATTEGITAEKLGVALGISRSTARRYLEYLVVDKAFYAELIYGSVGRPERRYFSNP